MVPEQWRAISTDLGKSGLTADEQAKVWHKLIDLGLEKAQLIFLAPDIDVALRVLLPGSQESIATPVPTPVSERDEAAKTLAKKLPAASSYAKQSVWSDPEYKKLLILMRTHRPSKPGADELQQLPVALLDKTLGQVEEDCAYATPSAEDVDFAQELMHVMSGAFPNEQARMWRLWQMMKRKFSVTFAPLKVANGETDGSLVVSLDEGLGLYASMEVKQDIGAGDGGDPRLQNCCYATQHYSSELHSDLRWLSRCPTLLLELSGPNLSLSGFAFGKHACCDQLSQTVSLLWQPKSELMLGAPRLVYALRHALPALQAFYKELANKPTPDQGQLFFPYPCSYTSPHGPQGFSYVKRLSDYTFHAVADGPALSASDLQSAELGPRNLFVKFCKNYSVEAHKALQDKGFAPGLLGCERLPGRWLMVIMELLPLAACTWDDVDTMEKPRDVLRAAVAALHDARFVHGDLRACNVMVDEQKVYLVDFEWAGKAGEAKYPFYMNRKDITWPPGATDNQPITKEHDVFWMEKLLSE
ncbi:hypothetical protein COCOBI_07-3460 [Coccomyxa sp. Obi]|nr:hypothetical protein COCOBI_07-3460 [Coccomyxa sp. Obi]